MGSVRERGANLDGLPEKQSSGKRENIDGKSPSDSVGLRSGDRDVSEAQGVLECKILNSNSVGNNFIMQKIVAKRII